MKHDDIIRLGILIVAIIFGYLAILNLINFVSFSPDIYSLGDSRFNFGLLVKAVCCAVACLLLVKYNRKITALIEEQK